MTEDYCSVQSDNIFFLTKELTKIKNEHGILDKKWDRELKKLIRMKKRRFGKTKLDAQQALVDELKQQVSDLDEQIRLKQARIANASIAYWDRCKPRPKKQKTDGDFGIEHPY